MFPQSYLDIATNWDTWKENVARSNMIKETKVKDTISKHILH